MKPYWELKSPEEGVDPDYKRLDNLEFESRENIEIRDIRPFKDNVQLEEYGFQVLPHTSTVYGFASAKEVDAYKFETEQMLQDALNGVFVRCYDFILRKNVTFQRSQFDLNDPLHVEGPARGAHNGKCSSLNTDQTQRHLIGHRHHLYIGAPGHFEVYTMRQSGGLPGTRMSHPDCQVSLPGTAACNGVSD